MDGRRLAVSGDVVVVTVNSRQGLLGYLGHPALPGSGNGGLAGQQAALRRVRDSIAAPAARSHRARGRVAAGRRPGRARV